MKKALQSLLISLFILQTNLHPQSPIVQQIIDSVNIDSLLHFTRELSGEIPTIINGTSRKISSRNSFQPGNALAEVYIKQKLESFGLQTTIQSFSTSGNNVIATQIGSFFPPSTIIKINSQMPPFHYNHLSLYLSRTITLLKSNSIILVSLKVNTNFR